MQNIILLHGALGGAEDLIPLAESLKKHNLNPLRFSFSGHSKTIFAPTFGIERFSEELGHFITSAGLINPPVFGYSMGGYVALNLACRQKNLTGKIITLGTKFNWNIETVEKEIRLLNADAMTAKVPAFAEQLEKKHGEHWKILVSKTALMMKEIGEKNFLGGSVLNALETPVLLGIGDRDQMVSYEETRTVFTQLKNAGMYMLPKSKHQIESANINLLSAIIKDFIVQN